MVRAGKSEKLQKTANRKNQQKTGKTALPKLWNFLEKKSAKNSKKQRKTAQKLPAVSCVYHYACVALSSL